MSNRYAIRSLSDALSRTAPGLALFLALVELTTASAQDRSNSVQSKQLDRFFRVQTREVLPASIERLESMLNEMASDPKATEVVSDEIEFARNALDIAVAARRDGRNSDAERAEQLVEAALILASRKLAIERVRTVLRETKRRVVEAEKAARQAEDALEAAMQKRAGLYLEQKK